MGLKSFYAVICLKTLQRYYSGLAITRQMSCEIIIVFWIMPWGYDIQPQQKKVTGWPMRVWQVRTETLETHFPGLILLPFVLENKVQENKFL